MRRGRSPRELGVPRMVFVNKLDRERANFERTLERSARPSSAPASRRSSCRSVRRPRSTASPTCSPTPRTSTTAARRPTARCPTSCADARAPGARQPRRRHRRRPTTSCSSATSVVSRSSADELEHTLARGVAEATVFPVVVRLGDEHGGDRPPRRLHLRDRPVARRPPARRGARRRHRGRRRPRSERRAAGVRVQDDRRPVRRPHLAVQGAVGHDPARRPSLEPAVRHGRAAARTVHVAGQGAGSSSTSVPAGDIAAVAKLTATATGDTLAPKGKPVTRRADRPARRPCSRPRSSPARRPTKTSSPTRCTACRKKTRRSCIERSEETKQTVHARHRRDASADHAREARSQVRCRRRHRRRARSVPRDHHRQPRTNVEGKHKKQSGGHGQFGVCVINVEPLPRGEGFEFVDKIVGGAIARGYIPAVQKGIEETMASGGVYGHPIVDVKVELHRRQAARRRLVRDGVQDRRAPRDPRGHGEGRRPSCSNRSRCSRSRFPPSTRATSWATSTPAAAACRARKPPVTASRR